MLRSVGAVLGGLFLGFLLVGAIEFLGHWVYPPPLGIEKWQYDQIASWARDAPLGVFLFVFVAWTLGAFVSALSACYLAGKSPWIPVGIVGLVFIAATGFNLVAIPHPLWFVLSAPLAVVASVWLGVTTARRHVTSS